GFVAFPAVTLACFAVEDRWSAFRIPVETAMAGAVLITIGVVRAWDDLDPSSSVRWSYLAALVVGLGLLVALYTGMERRAGAPPAGA
ncbi:MAG TPA: hypothetical protein VHE80_02270, partial [Acidimicrobiales bacterium]|nr:hypothetical protein [Acidimicrobiales bacterium]